MPVKRTLRETYYAINAALISALASNYMEADFIKFGIDPAIVNENESDATKIRYPYFQTWYGNAKTQSRTSKDLGILTEFDYQISYFSGITDVTSNDSADFIPFEAVKNFLTDTKLKILSDIVSLVGLTELTDFEFKAGVSVPSAVLLCRFRAMVAYADISIPTATTSTDLESAITVEDEDE